MPEPKVPQPDCIASDTDEIDSRRFRALMEIASTMMAMAKILTTQAFEVAILGPLRQWSEQQQLGTVVRIGVEELSRAGDRQVELIAGAASRLHAAAIELQNACETEKE